MRSTPRRCWFPLRIPKTAMATKTASSTASTIVPRHPIPNRRMRMAMAWGTPARKNQTLTKMKCRMKTTIVQWLPTKNRPTATETESVTPASPNRATWGPGVCSLCVAHKGRISTRLALAGLLVVLAVLSAATRAGAAESLDPSFGEGGMSFPGFRGDVRSLAQDANGRLLGGGGAGNFVTRYLDNGILDLSFGGGDGWAPSLEFGSRVNAVAIQRGGKILAASSM